VKSRLTMIALAALGLGCGGVSGAPNAAFSPDTVTVGKPADEAAPDGLICDRRVDDFGTTATGELPAAWETWDAADLEHARRDRAFVVEREDEVPLLRVQPASRELTLGRGVPGWDFRTYPVLEWRWRVQRRGAEAGDQPLARVGAVWLTGLPFIVRRIDYTWSTNRPLAAQEAARFGQDRALVVASRESTAGEWHTVRVDVRRHYAALFSSDDPEPPAGIAISAPESGPGTQAVVDYRDFRLCRYAAPRRVAE
jgi:hypothetical protein